MKGLNTEIRTKDKSVKGLITDIGTKDKSVKGLITDIRTKDKSVKGLIRSNLFHLFFFLFSFKVPGLPNDPLLICRIFSRKLRSLHNFISESKR